MKVLVCGGREFGMPPKVENFDSGADYEKARLARLAERDFLFAYLDTLLDTPDEPTLVITGGANGADRFAKEWAVCSGIRTQVFLAKWDVERKAAGPRRNQRMLDEGQPNLVIAFPGGGGTADMIARAKKAGVKVTEVPFEP